MNANEQQIAYWKAQFETAADIMLRQQQAEYYYLLVNHDKLYAKVVEQQSEIEELRNKLTNNPVNTQNIEPVAWMHKNPDYPISKHRSLEYNIPLYTHPAKTLTNEEIEIEWFKVFKPEIGIGKNLTNGIYEFARAILKKASEK
jgi:hypothetical protein